MMSVSRSFMAGHFQTYYLERCVSCSSKIPQINETEARSFSCIHVLCVFPMNQYMHVCLPLLSDTDTTDRHKPNATVTRNGSV